MSAPVFCSLFCYPLSKIAAERGEPEGNAIKREIEAGDASAWAGFRTLHRLRTLSPLGLHIDCSTLIAKARSHAAGQFWKRRDVGDVWVSIDDDCFADANALSALIQAARTHGVASLPYVSANGKTIGLKWRNNQKPLAETSEGGLRVADVDWASCGLFACSRDAINRMVAKFPHLVCDRQPDTTGHLVALFLEYVQAGMWIGEDAAFFSRTRDAGLVPKVVLDFETMHGSYPLPANWFDGLGTMEPSSMDHGKG